MTIRIKSQEHIEILREAGKRHAFILNELQKAVRPGVSSEDLDNLADKLIKEGGDKAAFLGYKPQGAKRPYPASLCVSINDEVVHGIPNENSKVLKEGDIVSLDLGLSHKGMITDMAITVPVGKIDDRSKDLIEVTRTALSLGIKEAIVGNTTGNIGEAIENHVYSKGFELIRELAGHGVGFKVHEDPYVPNFGNKGEGAKLVSGMVIAIEPIVSDEGEKIKLDKDGYTYKTKSGKRSAHFEHTILIKEDGPEILTKM